MASNTTKQVAHQAVQAVASTTVAGTTTGGKRGMSLLAIPLARARLGSQPIVTYLARASQPTAVSSSNGPIDASSSSSAADAKKLPLTTRLLNRASNFWIDLGKPGVKSTLDWKRRTYETGEKLMDRIEYQEWGLKGIDPALGPSLQRRKDRREEQKQVEGQEAKGIQEHHLDHIPLLYPSSSPGLRVSPSLLLSSLEEHVTKRRPYHKNWLIYTVIGMPFTIPFAAIPVVPNLPFFYLCWRAYSHWKAWSASDYLQQLLTQKRIEPKESRILAEILSSKASAAKAIEAPSNSSTEATTDVSAKQDAVPKEVAEDERMILKPHHIDMLVEKFQLDRQAAIDLRRARMQTVNQLQAAAKGDPKAMKGHVIEELEKVADAGEAEQKKAQ